MVAGALLSGRSRTLLFVVDQDRRVRGFLGWALTAQALAEQWVEGRAGLRSDECREGDCVIVNAFAADTGSANRFIVDTMRKLFATKRTLYFKRHYPDGRTRPTRLGVNEFVAGHLARSVRRREGNGGVQQLIDSPAPP
jgi:hemolysin-activating ACP:hemolysin acyltransferase